MLDSVAVPALTYNTSYGRTGEKKTEWARMTPTAGYSNDGAQVLKAEELAKPVFSAESGFYSQAFEVSIEAPEGTVIYYTLDGSDPTMESSVYEQPLLIGDASRQENLYAARTDLSPTNGYTPPFPVDKATVVRAVAYDPKRDVISRIETKSYFVAFDQKTKYADYPVISLVTDPDNLFDPDTGIYTNGAALEDYKEKGGMSEGELLGNFISLGGVITSFMKLPTRSMREKSGRGKRPSPILTACMSIVLPRMWGSRYPDSPPEGRSRNPSMCSAGRSTTRIRCFPIRFFRGCPIPR